MTNLTDNLTKEIRASSLDQERPSWLVGFVNEQYFFSVRIKSGHISILFTSSNSDHEHLICFRGRQVPRVKRIELYMFYDCK